MTSVNPLAGVNTSGTTGTEDISGDFLQQMEDLSSCESCGSCPLAYESSSSGADIGQQMADDLKKQMEASGVDMSKISSIESSVNGNVITITITLAEGVSKSDPISADSSTTLESLVNSLFNDIAASSGVTSMGTSSQGTSGTSASGTNSGSGSLEGYDLTEDEIAFCEANGISFKGECTGDIHSIIDGLEEVPEELLQGCPNGITIDFSNDPASMGAAGYYSSAEPGEINVLNGADAYTVIHELGHLMDCENLDLGSPSNTLTFKDTQNSTTAYGSTNSAEYWAETFAQAIIVDNQNIQAEDQEYLNELGIDI